MILAWRHGHSIGRYVLVDSTFPHPALDQGRRALKVWAVAEGLRRDHLGDEGPYRPPAQFALTTAVVEFGDVILRIWPTDGNGAPRAWTDGDSVWRDQLTELRRFVSAELMCCSRLEIMPGGGPIVRSQNAPSLLGINGFVGWKQGEREPRRQRFTMLRAA